MLLVLYSSLPCHSLAGHKIFVADPEVIDTQGNIWRDKKKKIFSCGFHLGQNIFHKHVDHLFLDQMTWTLGQVLNQSHTRRSELSRLRMGINCSVLYINSNYYYISYVTIIIFTIIIRIPILQTGSGRLVMFKKCCLVHIAIKQQIQIMKTDCLTPELYPLIS